ncbi:hypothetical protein ACFX2A_013554 [Malus domestica]
MSWKTLKHPGSRRIKKAFFVLRSSFFQDQAPTALWINNHPPIQDQAPTALEESLLRSSKHHRSSSVHQDQAPTALGSTNINKSTHPTVLQDQAQKPLKIRSSLFFKIKPKSPWRSVHHCSSKIKPKSPFEDPLKSTFKIKSTGLKECSSLDQARRPLDQQNIHKSTPYGDRIRGSNLREIEISVFTNWHAQWDNLCLSSLSPFKKFKRTSKINGIKEGSNCSRNWRKEQERHRRKWCHFRHHDSKQGKSYFCRLFHLCINSAKGTKTLKARAFDHLSLTKGTKGGKPKEILRIHALRCRFKRQFSHASHDHWSNFNR